MKSKKIILSLLCAGAAFGLASCREKTSTPEPTPTPTTPEVTPTEGEQKTPTQNTTVTYTATLVYNNGEANGSLTSVEDGGKYYFDKPANPTKPYSTFVGWFTDEALTKPYNFNSEVSASVTLYAKWAQAMDKVDTIWDFKACAETITEDPSGNVVVPGDSSITYQDKFTVEANGKARFEIGSKNAFNTQGKTVIVHLSAADNNNGITIAFKWSSSDDGKFVIKNLGTGEIICEEANSSEEVTKTFNNLPAGDYEIAGVISESKNASLRIYNLSVTELLPQGPTSGITTNTSNVQLNVLKGRDLDLSNLKVNLEYENGRKDLLDSEKYTISGYDKTKVGKQTITVTHQLNATTKYTDTFEVVVWEAKSLNVYDYTYNSVTNHARFVYFADETTKSADNIIVKALCEATGVEGTYEFLLSSDEYTVSKENTNKIEFAYGELDAEFNYVTVDKVDLSAAEEVFVSVDPSAQVSVANNVYTFNTIMQAMQFLELAKVSDNAQKYILLAAGKTFNEKVEVTLPNLTITTNFGNNEPSEAAYATIEYGLLAGYLEPGESKIYSTDGSATFSVRSSAENFTAGYINFVNSINTLDEYKAIESLTQDHQGVAVLVQADKAQFGWCTFSGYQDTLYAQVGRQYYEECYIEGHTDFIFGYDATAYFKKCEISSIGAGVEQNNGGYVVATKGKSGMKYGYIFDECNFTADENTMLGSISFARGWDKYMTMMVMNSTISGHYSKEAYGYKTPDNPATEDIDESKKNLNDRYGNMQADPNPELLLEYNNTGEGAITASIEKTCTVVDATVYAKYDSLTEVFAADNGSVKYATNWAATQTADVTVILVNGSEELYVINEYSGNTLIEDLCVAPQIENYRFVDWYADAALTTKYDFATVLTAGELKLYAKYEFTGVKLEDSYNVSQLTHDQDYKGGTVLFDGNVIELKTGNGSIKANLDSQYNNGSMQLKLDKDIDNGTVKDKALYFTAKVNCTLVLSVSASGSAKGWIVTCDDVEVANGSVDKNSGAITTITLELEANKTYRLSAPAGGIRFDNFTAEEK